MLCIQSVVSCYLHTIAAGGGLGSLMTQMTRMMQHAQEVQQNEEATRTESLKKKDDIIM